MNRISQIALSLTVTAGASIAFANQSDQNDVFSKMDTNHDGKVSQEEYVQSANRMFKKMDANHDGEVTSDEMKSAFQQKGRSAKLDRADEKIGRMDVNSDGRLDQSEWDAGALEKFSKMDTNHDGFVTRSEMQAERTKNAD